MPRRTYQASQLAQPQAGSINTSGAQTSPPLAHPTTNRHSRVIGITAAIVALIAIVVIISLLNSSNDPIPANMRATAPFTLYYPTKMPTGFSVNKQSIESSDGTVSLRVSVPPSETILITQQPLPRGFNPQVMFSHNPLPSRISPIGTVYDLSFKNQSRYMIVTSSSLVFVSSADSIANTQFQHVINNLVPASK